MVIIANYRKIIDLEDEIEAGLLSTELEKRKIPHKIVKNYDIAYNGLFQLERGWGHLEAPEKYRTEIMSIYSDLSR